MPGQYKWEEYGDRYIRNHPKNEAEEELSDQQAATIVRKFLDNLEQEGPFSKRVLKKLAPHVLKAMDRPQPKEDDEEEDSGASLI